MHDSQLVVEETTRRNMAVSFTSSTNWSNASLPGIDPEHPAAAKEFDMTSEDLAGGSSRGGPVPRADLAAEPSGATLPGHKAEVREQHLVAVIAARVLEDTSTGAMLDVPSIVDLTADVRDGALDWTAPAEGTWRIFAFWVHGTGQTASPSASVNYTVNYLDPDGAQAVIDYCGSTVLTPELREQIAQNPRAQMYMDSLELTTFGAGGMFWGHTVAEEFRSRRGYDIAPWLPFLTPSVVMMAANTTHHNEPGEEHRITVEKVRFDYVRTLTDLYIENMLRLFATFLHDNGMTLRAEISYGLPFELTRPGPAIDGIETESLEFGSQIDAYRLLAGPAHLFGKQYSSETGATTRNDMLPHQFYDQIIATQLAAGITKTVLHGWASTAGAEGVTEWPGHEGMWPMFSERFDTRQPGSEFYPLWTAAVGRYQAVLRRGKPRIDVGILRTDHFVDNMVGMALFDKQGNRMQDEDAYGRRWMRDRQNHWWQNLGMQDAGWTYEFFDGSLLLRDEVSFGDGLVQPDGPGYQALVVYQSALDPDAAANVLEEARAGLKVLLVHGTREVKLLMLGQYSKHERARLGYETREVRPTTAVTRLEAGTGPLRSWHELTGVGAEVSGVGEYTATLHLPESPAHGERYLLDLGSTAGGLGSVRVNGGEALGFDTSCPLIDLSAELVTGDNTLVVRVSSSLNNRLLARGYYDRLPDVLASIGGHAESVQTTYVRPAGLLGPVRLLREASAY